MPSDVMIRLRRDGCGEVFLQEKGGERSIGYAVTLIRHPVMGRRKVIGYVLERDGIEIGVVKRLKDAYNSLLLTAGITEGGHP